MEFTATYRHSTTLPSPCSRRIASIFQNRIVVRDAEHLHPLKTLSAPDTLSDLDWSPDGRLLLALALKSEAVYVWDIDANDKDPLALRAIIEGADAVGVRSARFAPDGRAILHYSDHDVNSFLIFFRAFYR